MLCGCNIKQTGDDKHREADRQASSFGSTSSICLPLNRKPAPWSSSEQASGTPRVVVAVAMGVSDSVDGMQQGGDNGDL
eukprot:505749-Pyramimonas_sp.AAC.1